MEYDVDILALVYTEDTVPEDAASMIEEAEEKGYDTIAWVSELEYNGDTSEEAIHKADSLGVDYIGTNDPGAV